MSWEKGRPKGWENPHSKLLEKAMNLRPDNFDYAGTRREAKRYEVGAEAMHKADLEFLGQFPDLILTIKATMTKEEWLAFTG